MPIVVGFALAWGEYIAQARSDTPEDKFKRFKVRFGRALLLGLEILVLADVIETITVTPTVGSLAFLAALIVVRTVVSWTLTLEVEERWPWQSPTEDRESV